MHMALLHIFSLLHILITVFKFFKPESTGGQLSSKPDTPSPSEQKSGSAWETLVLFAVNFTRLNVHMNMGNVMGNVT